MNWHPPRTHKRQQYKNYIFQKFLQTFVLLTHRILYIFYL